MVTSVGDAGARIIVLGCDGGVNCSEEFIGSVEALSVVSPVLLRDITSTAFVEVVVATSSAVARAEGSLVSGEGISATGVDMGVITSIPLISTASFGTIASDTRVSTFGIVVESSGLFIGSIVRESTPSARFPTSALGDATPATFSTSPGATP